MTGHKNLPCSGSGTLVVDERICELCFLHPVFHPTTICCRPFQWFVCVCVRILASFIRCRELYSLQQHAYCFWGFILPSTLGRE